jgi:diguanylate cyclase (GGDEF)-like protein
VQENDFFCGEDTARLPVTISIGVSSTDGDPDPVSDKLIIRADSALYEAKATGRNRVMYAQFQGGIGVEES